MSYSDMRFAKRLSSDCQCLVYVDNVEYKGRFVDISEEGVRIKIFGMENENNLKTGVVIKVVFIDAAMVTSIKVNVIWRKAEDNVIIFGGSVINFSDFEKYVTEKKVNAFMEKITNI